MSTPVCLTSVSTFPSRLETLACASATLPTCRRLIRHCDARPRNPCRHLITTMRSTGNGACSTGASCIQAVDFNRDGAAAVQQQEDQVKKILADVDGVTCILAEADLVRWPSRSRRRFRQWPHPRSARDARRPRSLSPRPIRRALLPCLGRTPNIVGPPVAGHAVSRLGMVLEVSNREIAINSRSQRGRRLPGWPNRRSIANIQP
jgi:hypothetical protein